MKHWKNLLVCLLAGVLALGVLTACSGLGSVNTGTDAEKAAELAQQLGVAYDGHHPGGVCKPSAQPASAGSAGGSVLRCRDAAGGLFAWQKRQEVPSWHGVRLCPVWCIILTVRKTMWTQEVCT